MVSSWQHSKEYVTYIFKISSYTASRLTPEPFIVDWYPFVDLTYIQYEVNKYWNTAIKLPLRSSFLAHCFFRQRMYPIFQSFSYIWLLPSRILWSTINYMHSICMWYNAPTMLPAVGRQHRGCIIPQAVTHSLVFLKMGKIISRNMLSWLELLISRYCCI